MSKYLSFDGVDDVAVVPHSEDLNIGNNFHITTVLAFKKNKTSWQVIAGKDSWTAKTGWALYYQASTINQIWFNIAGFEDFKFTFHPVEGQFYKLEVISDGATWEMRVDGVTKSSRTSKTIPINTSTLNIGARHTNNGTGTTDFYEGFIRQFQVKKNGNLSLDINMTLGNVQDQSGNGNHATLIGGTWVEEAPSGIDVSQSFATRQMIYTTRQDQVATKQVIYANKSTGHSIKQIIYAGRSQTFATKQVLYSDFVLFSADFPLRIVISKNVSQNISTKQAITATRTGSFPTALRITASRESAAALKQIIHSDSVQRHSTRQVVFAERLNKFALKIVMIDATKLIIGTVRLKGRRVLLVRLKGDRVLVVRLRGGLVTERNQDFEMVAGDTKTIEVPVTDVDLTGSTIRWALKKSPYSGNADVNKDTLSGGITITNTGEFAISLDPVDTENLSGMYFHEAEVTDIAGNVSTVMTGKAMIEKGIIKGGST